MDQSQDTISQSTEQTHETLTASHPTKKRKNFFFIGIIVCILILLSIGAYILLRSLPVPSEDASTQIRSSLTPTPTVPLKTEYSNPFNEKSQYENPFNSEETYKNPFDTSK